MAKIDFKENGGKGVESSENGAREVHWGRVSVTEIQAGDLAPEHIRQVIIAKLKSTPLAFEFNGKRQAFLSLQDLTECIELHTNYYNNLAAGKALGRSDLAGDIDRMTEWLTLANGLLSDVQSKLASGIYKGVRYDH